MDVVRTRAFAGRLGLAWRIAVCSVFWSVTAAGQPWRITGLEVDKLGSVHLHYQSDTNSYYITYRGSAVTNITQAVGMALGTAGVGALRDAQPPSSLAAEYYRARRVPLNQPLDSDGDGLDDVTELRYPGILNPLDPSDGGLLHVTSSSPLDGETDVAVSRETIFNFSLPLSQKSTPGTNNLYAISEGRRILSRVELSSDRKRVSLFYLEPLPGSARVNVFFDGEGLQDFLGRPIDPAGAGQTNGFKVVQFDTMALTPLAGTAVIGTVYASQLAPGPDTGTNAVNQPLAGVTITVDGMEESLRTVTDRLGNFKLEPVPPGRFFVHIDGRTVSNLGAGIHYPDKAYYPFVGKAWEVVAGREDNLAGGTGRIYLPLITAGTLQPVSSTTDTVITFPPSVTASNPALSGVTITVPANSLFSDDGTRGGKVGIAPVPPDRLPGPLPPGLELPIVITVQTDGPLNFDKPAPVCFPNLNNHPPGSKSALISFNHRKGVWEVIGPMTVSADGKFVCTDPGVGIVQPGWHGEDPRTSGGGGGPQPCPGPAHPQTPQIKQTPVSAGAGSNVELEMARPLGVPPIPVNSECGESCPQLEALFAMWMNILNEVSSFSQQTADVQRAEQAASANAQDTQRHADSAAKFEQLVFQSILQAPKCSAYEITAKSLASLAADAALDATLQAQQVGELASQVAADADELNQALNEASTALANCDMSAMGLAAGKVSNLGQAAADDAQKAEAANTDIANDLLRASSDDSSAVQNYNQALTCAGASQSMLASANAPGDASTDSGRPVPGQPSIPSLLSAPARRLKGLETVSPALNAPTSVPADGLYFYSIDDVLDNRSILRGQTRIIGNSDVFRDVILAPDRLFRAAIVHAETLRSGFTYFRTGPAGSSVRIPPIVIGSMPGPNSDGDGLADVVESFIGTDPKNPDTNGDGIPDGQAVALGLDPLAGMPAQTGILGTAATPGAAIDICTEDGLAMVAEGANGVSLFNVGGTGNPILISQWPTAGNAQRVATDGSFLAIADGPDGLAIVDLSDPGHAQLAQRVRFYEATLQRAANVTAVALAGRSVFAGLDSQELALVELYSGSELSRLRLPAAVQDLAVSGDYLYVVTPDQLHVLAFAGGKLQLVNSVPSPHPAGGNVRLAAGAGIVYAVHVKGYNTFSLSNAAAPALITAGNTAQFGWRQLAPNGTGLGIAAVGPNSTPDGRHDISLYDLSQPKSNDLYITTFPMPAYARAVALTRGQAYVAADTAGLQVVNYLPYDAKHQPPTILLITSFGTNAVSAGHALWAAAKVADDVQVREVEFYLDGVKTVSRGHFPFEYRFEAPVAAASKSSFKLRARAIDTGGNAAWSDELTVPLTADVTAPEVVRVIPSARARDLRQITVYLSKPAQSATLNPSTVQVLGAGPDGVLGTADDSLVPGASVKYVANLDAAVVSWPAAFPLGKYRGRLTTDVTDASGNHLASEYTWDFEVVDATFYVGPDHGAWNQPANWSPPVVPVAGTAVIIDTSVTVSLGGATSVLANSIDGAPGASLEVPSLSHLTLDVRTLNVPLGLRGNAQVKVVNQLVLNSTVTIDGSINATAFNLEGTQPLLGSGRVFFNNGDTRYAVLQALAGNLTIGPDITIQGVGGTVGNSAVPLLNQGTIVAGNLDSVISAGGAQVLSLVGSVVTNAGSLIATNGGTLGTQALQNSGRIAVNAGSVLSLDGAWLNTGGIDMNQGTVVLRTFTPEQLGNFRRTGGTVVLTGTINNQGKVLSLPATVGQLMLQGATISGGIIEGSASAGVEVAANSGATWDALTLNTDVAVHGNAKVRVLNGLTVNGNVRLEGSINVTALNFDGVQTLDGAGSILFDNGDYRYAAVQPIAGGLTIGQNITVYGLAGQVGNPDLPLLNLGTIQAGRADSPAQGGGNLFVLRLVGSTVTNQGNVTATSGGALIASGLQNAGRAVVSAGSTLSLDGAWKNDGVLSVTNGTVNLGGTFTSANVGAFQRSGGTLAITGTCDNRGQTLDLGTSLGSLTLAGGTLQGGTILGGSASIIQVPANGSGTLDGVTLNANLVLQGNAKVRVVNGLTLNSTATLQGQFNITALNFDGTQTLDGAGDVSLTNGSAVQPSAGTLAIGPQVTLHGAGTIGNPTLPLVNNGTITADLPGQTLTVRAKPFTNNGTTSEVNGGKLSINP